MRYAVPSLLLCALGLLPVGRSAAQNTAVQPSAAETAARPDVQTGIQSAPPADSQTMPTLGGTFPKPSHTLIPQKFPELPPELMELVKLEGEFEKAVAKGGGPAFASWFADDAVTLNNGEPAVQGHTAIAEHATWDPKDYQLTWFILGAQMGPSKDTAFTWGHYDASGTDRTGKPFTFSGRYTTFWKKVGGKWKVALDASSNEPPDPGSPSAPPPCTQAHPR
jgi:ketosteroid isomerase-like protein